MTLMNWISFLNFRYNRVVDVCSLRADFDILPYGDETEVRTFLLFSQTSPEIFNTKIHSLIDLVLLWGNHRSLSRLGTFAESG